MKLSPTDQLILGAAFLLLLVTCIYVPLIDCSYEDGVCIKGGWDWLWTLGSEATPFYSIDKFRLFVEWVAIAALAGIAWTFTRETRSGPREPFDYRKYTR